MLRSFVCRQCRARISRQIAPVRTPQWQSRATFLSLRRNTANNEAEPQPESTPAESQRAPQKQNTSNAPQPEVRQRQGRYARLVPETAEVDAGHQEEQEAEQQPLWQKSSDRTNKSAQEGGPEGSAELINAVLKNGRIYTAWRLFDRMYTSRDCEALTNPHANDVPLLKDGRIFSQLLVATNVMYCRNPATTEVTPTMALFKLDKIGAAPPDFWVRRTLSYLTYRTILAVNGLEATASMEHLLAELLSVWRLFFQFKGVKGMPLDSISEEWNLPAVEQLPHMFESRHFTARLQDLHPGHLGDLTTGFCAVYLYTLSDALKAIESLQYQAEPLIQVIGRLLPGSFVDKTFLHMERTPHFNSLPEEIKQDIIKEINGAPAKAMRELGETHGEVLGEEQHADKAANLEAFYLKRMSRVVKSKGSVKQLETLWHNALKDFKENDEPAVPARVYNAFLNGFIVLLRPQRSVEIWNHMIEHGIQPDVQTWVALLEGCAKARDHAGFNAMWARMLNSGIEPDVYLWTARVHGLFSMRQISQGMAALDEMGNRWLAGENPQVTKGKTKPPPKGVNNQPKPSIEVVNGAITGLTQMPRSALSHEKCVYFIQKLLSWAGAFQIRPDAITYNSLMKLYIREGDSQTAYGILQQMEREGIEADIATHNILFAAAFDNASFKELSKPAQTEKVKSLFDSLEQSGFKLNEYLYSTAIDKLLKHHSNYEAVGELITHMHARNLVPSAHVYTSLVTYYFQLNPPAIPNVDAIVHQVFTSQRVPTDRVLFDRILEGYAAAGEVTTMMDVLRRMANHSRVPTWAPLTAVVEALVRDGDKERARQVVRDVVRGEGIAKGGIMGGKAGEAKFFALAQQNELLEESMGDMWGADRAIRAIRASANEQVLGQQLRAQEIDEIVRGEEAQDVAAAEEMSETAAQFSAGGEEDVHGFLRDEHHDIQRKVQKP